MNISKLRLLQHPAGWIASGFGAGFSPIAAGTVGSVVALLPWLMLRELPGAFYLGVLGVAFLLGVWTADWVIRRIAVEDPSVVVWDEFVGLWIALAFAPRDWIWIAVGFMLFRLFDIWKPWPVRWADANVKGGLGAMLDDALAGGYALITLQGLTWAAGASLFGG